MPQFYIRKMHINDVSAVHDIETSVFSLPWSRGAFQTELSQNRMANYFVMVEGSTLEIVGYIGTWIIIDEAHITTVAVKNQYQGMKLGSRLLEQAMTELLGLGVKSMTLEVRVSNARAIKMYENYGFRQQGVRKGYYSDNQEDAIIMWAVLEENESDQDSGD